VSTIVKAEGPNGRAKIRSDDPKYALSLVHYLRTIGYKAWIEDTNGNEIEEAALKKGIRYLKGSRLTIFSGYGRWAPASEFSPD